MLMVIFTGLTTILAILLEMDANSHQGRRLQLQQHCCGWDVVFCFYFEGLVAKFSPALVIAVLAVMTHMTLYQLPQLVFGPI